MGAERKEDQPRRQRQGYSSSFMWHGEIGSVGKGAVFPGSFLNEYFSYLIDTFIRQFRNIEYVTRKCQPDRMPGVVRSRGESEGHSWSP